MIHRTSLAWLAAGLLLALAPPTLRAAPPADDPTPALQATINAVLDQTVGLPPSAVEAKLDQIRTTMSQSFAIEAIVQRAFGRNWAKLAAPQQAAAIDLLGKLVIRAYAVEIATGERPVVKITSSRLIAPDRREVTSTISQGGKTVNVVYRLAPFEGKWKVYDVLAENISVVGNYRQQFDAHFQNGDADSLLQTLRDKLAAPEPTKTP